MNAMMRLTLLLGLVVSCVNAACPSNFVASTTIPGKCYYITTTRTDFFSAINYCRNLTYGVDILSIANGFENSEVASLLEPREIYYAWIGSAFYDNKSHWIATAASNSNYSNWGLDNWNGHAATIMPSGSWGYAKVDYPAFVICQIYPDDPTTFPPQITCPAGWTPSISVRGKCYQPIGRTDFFSAMRQCLTTRIGDSHAELVTLTSQLEMIELYGMQFNSLWASLTSWETDGRWRWVETLHPTNYSGPDGRPRNFGGTCVYSDRDNLYGTECGRSQAAICQYFPDEPSAPPLHSLNCPRNNNTWLRGIASITKPGTCYYFLNQNQAFQSARSACQASNTGFNHNDLFVPRTAAEYEEFETIFGSLISYRLAWLGLTNSNGNWSWVSGQPSNISNMWCSEQPDTSQNPNHQCAFVSFSNICWTAGDCTDPYPAVCQSTNTF